MTVPATFVGAWRRTELVVEGVAVGPDQDADVLWLQGSTWYADLRIPMIDGGGPVEAFAGPARWADPWFTWEHHLDWLGTFPSDEGTFEVVGDALVERGSFEVGGRAVPYQERWVRAAAETDVLVARLDASSARAVLVEVGPHRLVLVDARGPDGSGAFAARRDEQRDGIWRTSFARGPGLVGAPVGFDRPHAIGDEIGLGAWTLTVTEIGGGASTGPATGVTRGFR